MFTGIISAVGEIVSFERQRGDVRLKIDTGNLALDHLRSGDSVACNGICLTAVELTGTGFVADVSVETLNLTTIGDWKVGMLINLENAMQACDRFGGHIVSGHIDGMGEVCALHEDARSWRFRIAAPSSLSKYIARKGSITVDGTSLTVNQVERSEFDLNIIPQTMTHTIFGHYRIGTKVNLEVDLVARYLERLIKADDYTDN